MYENMSLVEMILNIINNDIQNKKHTRPYVNKRPECEFRTPKSPFTTLDLGGFVNKV